MLYQKRRFTMKSNSIWKEKGTFESAVMIPSVTLLMLSSTISPLILTDTFRVSLTSVIPMSIYIASNIAAAAAPSYLLGAFSSYENRKVYENLGGRGLVFAATTAIAGYLGLTPAANLACSVAVQALPMLVDHAKDFFNNPAAKVDIAVRALQCSFFAGTALAASCMFDVSAAYMASTAIVAASIPILARRIGVDSASSLITGGVLGGATGVLAYLAGCFSAVNYMTGEQDYSRTIVAGKLALVVGLTALNMCSLAIRANNNPQNQKSVMTSIAPSITDFNIERQLFGKGSGSNQQKSFGNYLGFTS